MSRKVLRSLAGAAMVAAGLALITPPAAAAAPAGFVTRSGSNFSLDGKPFVFGGSNNYYLHYKSELMVDDVFSGAQAMGLKVMRAWNFLECGGAKPDSDGGCSQGPDLWMQRWSATTDTVEYNEAGLRELDYMLASAAQHNVRMIMVLTGNWKDFGGMDQYVKWFGGKYHDEFYTHAGIRQAYKDWAKKVITRTNTITGKKYVDDPTIFSWELANEPRCINASLPTSGKCTTDTLVTWADEMSRYIKSLDANHMVSVGDEGFLARGNANQWAYNAADGVDNERLTGLDTVDFGTYHMYPGPWGYSFEWGTQWIVDHNKVGQALDKPMVLEEFGISDQAARPDVYTEWTNAVKSGGGDGWMFWILTGVQDDGQLYADYDGYRVVYPSAMATLLSDQAAAFGGDGSDSIPPTRPGTPSASKVTASSAALSWGAATDKIGVVAYTVVRVDGTSETEVAATTTATTATIIGLAPSTSYTFAVYAKDAAGNRSPRSTTISVMTAGTTVGTCLVNYKITNEWQGGFQADISIKNTGTSAINGWTLKWTFPNGQTVKSVWNGTVTTNGAEVTVKDAGWNGAIAAGTIGGAFGLSGTWKGSNTSPTTFALNGASCATAA